MKKIPIGIDFKFEKWYNYKKYNLYIIGDLKMKHIKTLATRNLCKSAKNGGCGECQTSCQSACKTSCGIANQKCENAKKEAKESK